MDVGPACVNGDAREVVWSASVTVRGGHAAAPATALSYRVPPEHGALLSTTLDAALVGLLIPAMHSGEDLHLDGPVSSHLLGAANSSLQESLRVVIPRLRRIHVSSSSRVPGTAPAEGVATGFSAGVDSYFTVLRHRDASSLHGTALTHLVHSNVGSHGINGREVFAARTARLIRPAGELGISLVPVDSNLSEFYRLPFQQTHSLRNASIAHLLAGGIGRYLSSSTGSDRDARLMETGDIASADNIILPLLSTPTVQVESAGGDTSRFRKTLLLTQSPSTFSTLQVCAKSRIDAKNCSMCWKCLRTMVTLDVLGSLEEYSESFDLTRYRLLRQPYLIWELASDNLLTRDLLDEASAAGYFPLHRAERWRFLSPPLQRLQRLGMWARARAPRGLITRARRTWNRL